MKKSIISIVSALTGAAIAAGTVGKAAVRNKEKTAAMSDKYLALFLMMNLWVRVKQEGKNLSEYFVKNGYYTIAVYGMGRVGETLIDELKNSEVKVAYGIDKNVDGISTDVDMFSVEGDLKVVDAVVVTAITFFNEIEQKLSEKVSCPIISIEDVLYEI